MNHNIEYLASTMRGGTNRIKILSALISNAHNPNQLSRELNIEYKTVLHHLKVLKENEIVSEKKLGKKINVYEVKEEVKGEVETVINGKNNIGIAIINNHLKIEYVNNTIRKLFKLNGVESKGINEVFNDNICDTLKKVFNDGKEVKIKDKGTIIEIVPMRDKEGKTNKIIISAQD